jgi:hypothetical protein
MLKVHQKKECQGAGLSSKLPANKHKKGRMADSRQAISHSTKQGRKWITELIF